MSDQWVDTGIGRPSANNDDRLTRAVGPQAAADIRASALDNPGSVQKSVYHVPDFGDPGTEYPQGPYTI